MGLLGKVRGYMRSSKGQTMTEYVLVVSAVAVAVYAGYQRTGQILNTMVSTVLTLL
jgi:Flp pilus assembly pilin Flp